MSTTNRNIDYTRCEATNSWRSIDAHSEDAAGSILLSFFPVKAVNIWWMDVYNQSENRLPTMRWLLSLTLRWRSFSGCGRHHVNVSFADKGSQQIGYASQLTNCCLITVLIKQRIVDAPLRIIFDVLSIQHLLPLIIVFIMIRTYW